MRTRIKLIRILVLCLMVLWFVPQILSISIVSKQSFEEIRETLLQTLSEEDYPAQDIQTVRRYLGIEPGTYSRIGFYRSEDSLNARELVLVETDQNQQDIRQALEERQSSQMQIFEGYAPEQFAMTQDGFIDIENNYIIYYVGDQPEEFQQQWIRALKGEK